MSAQSHDKRISVTQIQARKGREKIVSLTAFTKPVAELLDPHIDLFIVGDSVGMVGYGMANTLGVTLDMMISHGSAVMRGSSRACVVIDMPFGSYQESPTQAFRNAARVIVETGAQAVKIEGGPEMVETVRFLTQRGIPVMPHIGLMPQHVNTMGGFKAQGRDEASAQRLLDVALAFTDAGAFSLLIEGTGETIARRITEAVPVPTIGIGASPACDGRVLVTEDILGLFSDFTPKFAKRYVDLAQLISQAAANFASDVRAGSFPGAENCFIDRERKTE